MFPEGMLYSLAGALQEHARRKQQEQVMLTPQDKSALRLTAEAATPGPWIAGDEDDSDFFLIGPESYAGLVTHPVVKLHAEKNAFYLAAANPTTTLALLDEIAAMQKEIAGLRATVTELQIEVVTLDNMLTERNERDE